MSLIECILKRPGGSRIDLGDVIYHFKPQASGAHVAEVADDQHARRLLAIRESFRPYTGELSEPVEEPTKAEAKTMVGNVLLGSDVHESSYTIGGTTYSLGEIVAAAFDKEAAVSGMTIAAWNELPAEERHNLIDVQLDALADAAGEDDDQEGGDGNQNEDPVDPKAERKALAAEYEAKFGKKPHFSMKAEAIKAKLLEA